MPGLVARITMLVLVVLLSACAAGDDAAQPGPDETMPDVPDQPDDEDTDGQDGGDATAGGRITGTLGGDAELEGGCAWVEAEDGTRYEVAYPDGYEVARDGSELRGPDGEVIARAGDEITVVGEIAEDMMSFCQVGPMFTAVEVEA